MKRNCSTCPYGGYSALSDVCDGCMRVPDTGWGGFTDYSTSDDYGNPIHFNNEKEQHDFYQDYYNDEDDEGPFSLT